MYFNLNKLKLKQSTFCIWATVQAMCFWWQIARNVLEACLSPYSKCPCQQKQPSKEDHFAVGFSFDSLHLCCYDSFLDLRNCERSSLGLQILSYLSRWGYEITTLFDLPSRIATRFSTALDSALTFARANFWTQFMWSQQVCFLHSWELEKFTPWMGSLHLFFLIVSHSFYPLLYG